jgi:hypothetical protein
MNNAMRSSIWLLTLKGIAEIKSSATTHLQ